ncbi:MAG: hypothetical protein LBD67_07450 [Candidatus Accumulibacter sp.]|nr:hypothetical protein [Accumulibacter sp.]
MPGTVHRVICALAAQYGRSIDACIEIQGDIYSVFHGSSGRPATKGLHKKQYQGQQQKKTANESDERLDEIICAGRTFNANQRGCFRSVVNKIPTQDNHHHFSGGHGIFKQEYAYENRCDD